MNQKLLESLAQIILSLSNEEQQWLQYKIQKSSISKQVKNLESRLKKFEELYQMSSDSFHQCFQAGELEDTIDFFEWNTYYEMLNAAQV